MRAAIDAAGAPPAVAERLHAYFDMAAEAMGTATEPTRNADRGPAKRESRPDRSPVAVGQRVDWRQAQHDAEGVD
jgi:hypothetical protein